MTAAFGKSCGACTMCCSALEIDYFKKPPGPKCVNCLSGGGCGDLCRPAGSLSRLRVRVADAARPVAAIAPGPRRHDPYGGRGQRRIPGRLRAGEADGLAPSDGVRPSGRDGQVRPNCRREGGSYVMAHFRLGRMGTDGLIGCPIIGQGAYLRGAGTDAVSVLTS